MITHFLAHPVILPLEDAVTAFATWAQQHTQYPVASYETASEQCMFVQEVGKLVNELSPKGTSFILKANFKKQLCIVEGIAISKQWQKSPAISSFIDTFKYVAAAHNQDILWVHASNGHTATSLYEDFSEDVSVTVFEAHDITLVKHFPACINRFLDQIRRQLKETHRPLVYTLTHRHFKKDRFYPISESGAFIPRKSQGVAIVRINNLVLYFSHSLNKPYLDRVFLIGSTHLNYYHRTILKYFIGSHMNTSKDGNLVSKYDQVTITSIHGAFHKAMEVGGHFVTRLGHE